MTTKQQAIFQMKDGAIISAGMLFGRKPVLVMGPTSLMGFVDPNADNILVVHVTGSLEYVDGGGHVYKPSRFIMFRVLSVAPNGDGIEEFACEVVGEFAGRPTKPRKLPPKIEEVA